MGLEPMNKDAAVDFLMGRGLPATNAVIVFLLEAFPDFAARWKEHIALWGGNPAGSYNDMAEFVHFVVEDLYEKEKARKRCSRAFDSLEGLLCQAPMRKQQT